MNLDEKDISFLQDPNLIEKNLIFDGQIMRLYNNKMKLANQKVGYRELVHHDPAVSILAITPEGKVALVKQYRPAVAEALLEIPAGLIDRQEGQLEDPLLAAQRELEEETARASNEWEFITSFYLSPGMLNEEMFLYKAINIYEVADPRPQDVDEDVTVSFHSKDEIRRLIREGYIKDAKTAYALQYFLTYEKGESNE